jgi:hypothetical protein
MKATEASVATDSPVTTRQPGPHLLYPLVRVVWALLMLLPLGLFVLALPAEIARLHSYAVQAEAVLHRISGAGVVMWFIEPARYTVLTCLLEVALMCAFAAAAVIIGLRAPRDRMALFISVTLVSFGALATPALDSLVASQPQWEIPAQLVRAIGLECEVLIFYLSPDGRFFPRWTRLLALIWTLWRVVALLTPAGDITFVAADPHTPLGAPPPIELVAFFAAFILWIGSGLAAQVARYRTLSTPIQRQQTKWVMIGVAVAVAGYIAYVLPRLGVPGLSESEASRLIYSTTVLPLYLTALFLVPLAIAFSMLRFHLWNVDIVIKRTLVYGTLSALLAFIYVLSVFVLQQAARPLTGHWSAQQPLILALSTLLTAALFEPLRSRIQRTIDRRFYRAKYDAALTLESFAATLRTEVDLSELSANLLAVVESTFHPTHVSLWLREPPETPRQEQE